jgi:hypothetical protein
MIAVRIPKRQWGKAWRAMIEVAPVRLIADDPIYEVMPAHLEILTAAGVRYEVLEHEPRRRSRRKGSPVR